MIEKKTQENRGSGSVQSEESSSTRSFKNKEGFFDISVCSVIIIIFSIVASALLLIPDTRTISFIEIVDSVPSLQTESAANLLNNIRQQQSIENEKEKIDKNLAALAQGGGSDGRMFYIDSWTAEQAIEVLEAARYSPDADIPSRIAGIKERAQKVDDKKDEIARLTEETDPDVTALQTLSKESEALQNHLDNYIAGSIEALNDDDVDRGAFGGILREHRAFRTVTENVALFLAMLTLVCFVITIIAWVTKLYRLRLIMIIADLIMTLTVFFVPLAIWSLDYKWSFEVSRYITYGFNFGVQFIFVLLSAIASFIVGFAYFSDVMSAKKQN